MQWASGILEPGCKIIFNNILKSSVLVLHWKKLLK